MKFSEFYTLQEASVLRPTTKGRFVYPDERQPLKDTDTIRVYHGFNNITDLFRVLKRGMSGQEYADRIYSYEFNNNPKGLFVTISLDIAKRFGSYIAEIHTKVSDLESPVWPGGSYTVQGQMSQSFNDESDRDVKRLENRDAAKKSEYSSIRDSDRPELAEILYHSSEQQALFVGNLNSNSVRAVWANTTPDRAGEYSTFERMRPKEFMDKFYKKTNEYDPKMYKHRVFKAREKFDMEVFLDRMEKEYVGKKYNISRQEIIDTLRGLSQQALLVHIWPHQLPDALKAIENL